ncbi:hypothetical protein IGI04_016705 [Brassica rapa subsp. trilocularis]|uniref:Uncharacterized protein n=1 Tax=Brassica rapa subsp. trilocularis TaxID=1813537 RepID=A0ABQ7MTQ9_BRACM|nr:hypothetical protein IGI04_016705 [Brassica rapa subsp. trilocularis]
MPVSLSGSTGRRSSEKYRRLQLRWNCPKFSTTVRQSQPLSGNASGEGCVVERSRLCFYQCCSVPCQEAEKAMGCLDASRGGMFLHCASSCWKEFCQDYFSCPKQKQGSGWFRDYYYRLVRRMNKLLGPELSLDAKNPKDTNAAMALLSKVDMLYHVSCRWSLLEKHSCKASKLHLKPRRFKLFLEALEHQLLKDSRKSTSKRACHGETFSSASLENISSQSRERGLDNRPLKMILCDSQNVKKLGPGRASTKHGDSLGASLGDEKEDTAFRGGRQRRKQGSYLTLSSSYLNMVRTESGPLPKHSTGDSNEPRLATNAVSAGEWADTLTNISIGDLLSEAPDDIDSECVDQPATEGSHCLLRDASFASDSFDAAIAAHILRHQNKPPSSLLQIHAMHDEDTRDAFSFQKNRLAGSSKLAYVASPGGGEPSHLVEATSGDEGPRNFPDQQRDPMEEGPTTIKSPGKKTLCGFADVYYWPDSLGPMDLDIRSSKHTEDLNLNKSLDGLRRLIATSLDAFQNCSVFGFDSTKDTSNMV